MKTKTINLYLFEELSEENKQKVIAKYVGINVNYNWWEDLYDDAEEVGIIIKGFDIDRANYVSLVIRDYNETATLIVENWGEDDICEAAKLFLEKGNIPVFLSNLEKYYLKSIKEDYNYLTSDESIADTLRSNEYYFNEKTLEIETL